MGGHASVLLGGAVVYMGLGVGVFFAFPIQFDY